MNPPTESRRRQLRAAVKYRQRGVRDRLAEGATPRWRAAFVLGSLQACAMRAGWGYERIQRTIYPMAERIRACVMHGRRDAAAQVEIATWR